MGAGHPGLLSAGGARLATTEPEGETICPAPTGAGA